MGFRNGAYATVWSVEEKSQTMTNANISVSVKNKETGEWKTEFTGFVDFIGTANAAKALKLKRGDRIKLGDVDVCRVPGKKDGMYFTNLKVFSFEMAGKPGESSSSREEPDIEAGPEDDGQPALPF